MTKHKGIIEARLDDLYRSKLVSSDLANQYKAMTGVFEQVFASEQSLRAENQDLQTIVDRYKRENDKLQRSLGEWENFRANLDSALAQAVKQMLDLETELDLLRRGFEEEQLKLVDLQLESRPSFKPFAENGLLTAEEAESGQPYCALFKKIVRRHDEVQAELAGEKEKLQQFLDSPPKKQETSFFRQNPASQGVANSVAGRSKKSASNLKRVEQEFNTSRSSQKKKPRGKQAPQQNLGGEAGRQPKERPLLNTRTMAELAEPHPLQGLAKAETVQSEMLMKNIRAIDFGDFTSKPSSKRRIPVLGRMDSSIDLDEEEEHEAASLRKPISAPQDLTKKLAEVVAQITGPTREKVEGANHACGSLKDWLKETLQLVHTFSAFEFKQA